MIPSDFTTGPVTLRMWLNTLAGPFLPSEHRRTKEEKEHHEWVLLMRKEEERRE